MARTGRPKAELVLSDVERDTLVRWSRRAKTAQSLALRSRIVLACADGASNKEVATSLRVVPATVGKWRARFITDRLDGLSDEPRPGAARTITDEQVEAVVVKTLEEAPANGDTHWSTRSMARTLGMSQTAISRIWRAFGLKPHLVDTWKLSKDPQFIDKVRDVVGLVSGPAGAWRWCCAWTRSRQIQALDRSAPILPMTVPGCRRRPPTTTSATAPPSLFAALDIATGRDHRTRINRRHRHQEFLKFLKTDRQEHYPPSLDLHRDLSTTTPPTSTPAIQDLAGTPTPGSTLHFTPDQRRSWLNLVERWFAELTRRKLRRSTHHSVRELETDVNAWIEAWNQDPKPFVWTKTADEILANLANYCTRLNQLTSNSGH